jgi:hypothetical protein
LIVNVGKKALGSRPETPGIEERQAKRSTFMCRWLSQLSRTTAPSRVVNRI